MNRALILVLTFFTTATALAETTTRYLVATRRPAREAGLGLLRDAEASAARQVRTFEHVRAFAADLTEEEAKELRSAMDVRYLAPVVERHISSDARRLPVSAGRYDSRQSIPYGLDLIRARDVWVATRGAHASVNMVVMDTGIDANHPDLKARYIGGYDVFAKSANQIDDNGHGTHVAGTIAALDNSVGVVGVAPEVRLWGVKVLRASGSGTDESVIAGVDWVIAKKREIGGNWIINLSLGSAGVSDIEREAFARAVAEGILPVAAAGNRGESRLDIPAAYPGVLAVSAIDSSNMLASFSSFGTGTAFAAPGVAVLSTIPVDSREVSEVEVGNALAIYSASPLTGSKKGEATGEAVYCGVGKPEEVPADLRGKIAVFRRGGDIYFRDKARRARLAGAAGVIILPFDDSHRSWTLLPGTCPSCPPSEEDLNFDWGVVVSTSLSDGEKIIAAMHRERITVSSRTDSYAMFSGTSMATPHVAGAAALVWSLVPNASAEDVRLALKLTASDLGPAGYDVRFGYGRVDALAAAKYLAPAAFNAPPPQPPPRARRGGH